MVRLARVAAILVALAACGGGSDSTGPPASVDPTTTTTTSAGRTEIDLRRPIPAGSLSGTPRPPLENTGDDYVAILESLVANFRWLTENPDPAFIDDLFVPGSEIARVQGEVISELATNRWRAADDGYRLLEVRVAMESPDSVTLQVTDQVDFEQVVDVDGDRVGEGIPHRAPQSYTVILARSDDGSWQIADAVITDDTTVEL